MQILAQSSTAQTLREYQHKAVDAITTSWNSGETPLIWAATGAGKTTVFSQLLVETVNPATMRALVFAETQEIIYQMAERIRNQFGEMLLPFYGPRFYPGIGIVMGAQDNPDARIVVATWQSLHTKRLARVLESGPFDVVVVDECDHVSADNSYMKLVNALRKANPNVKVVGFTATPKRTDKKGLGVLFTGIPFRWTILDGIQGGYLSPVTRIKIKTEIDASHIRTREGDYDQSQLVGVLEANNWIKLCIDAYKEYGQSRQTLAFFPEVAMSREFAKQLTNEGILTAHIDATTPKPERNTILQRYQRGEIKVVSNMAVLTRGFDAPTTSAILLARPTRSETLFTQIVGRGLRMFPGKTDCLVLDVTITDTKALEIGTILGQMADCGTCGASFWKGLKQCPQCGADVDEAQVNTKTCVRCGAEMPRNARVCPECGYVPLKLIEERPDKGHGSGLRAEYASLFSQVQAAWHVDKVSAAKATGSAGGDGWFSVSLGFDNAAFVIAPPSYAGNTDRLRERIQRGWAMLPTLLSGDHTDPELTTELQAQIAQLERELARIEQYSLYYLPPVPKDPYTGRDNTRLAPDPTYLRSNADLAALMTEADSEARLYGEYSSAIDKDAHWRDYPASPNQISYLKRLGYSKAQLNEDITRGDAASMITHKKAVARMLEWLDKDRLADPNPPIPASSTMPDNADRNMADEPEIAEVLA